MNELTQLSQFTHYCPELDYYFHLKSDESFYWTNGGWQPCSVSESTESWFVPKYNPAAGAPPIDWVNAPANTTMVSRESGIFYRMYNRRIHYFADGEWREFLWGLGKITRENLLANPIVPTDHQPSTAPRFVPAVTAADILQAGVRHMANRAVTYDSPQGERSMGKSVAMFNVLHDTRLTEEQGWQFMEILKMVRASQGEFKQDNYEDGAAYAALAGESAARERGKQEVDHE